MKNNRITLFTVLLITCELLSGCTTFTVSETPAYDIVSVVISYEQTSYFEYDSIDLSTLSVTVTKENNQQEIIQYSSFGVNGLNVKLLNNNNEEININNELAIGEYTLVVYLNSNQNIKDEISISVIEETFPSIGGELLSDLLDSFETSGVTYTSTNYLSLKIFNDSFNNGTLI